MVMRLWRLHVLRSALALALFAGFLATPAGIAHVGAGHHDLCDAGLLNEDPAGPRVQPSAGFDARGHCFTCHWFQSLRSSLAEPSMAIPSEDAASALASEAPSFAAAAESLSTGARAPPA